MNTHLSPPFFPEPLHHPTYNGFDKLYHASDEHQLIRHATMKGIHCASLLSPIVVLALRARRPIPILRTYASLTFLVGGTAGLAIGALRTVNMTAAGVATRAERLRHNAELGREDEMSVLGAALGAVVGPALLHTRVPIPSAIVGGAALGCAAGLVTHLIKNQLDGRLSQTRQGLLGMYGEVLDAVRGTDQNPESEEDRRTEKEAAEYWSPKFEGV